MMNKKIFICCAIYTTLCSLILLKSFYIQFETAEFLKRVCIVLALLPFAAGITAAFLDLLFHKKDMG